MSFEHAPDGEQVARRGIETSLVIDVRELELAQATFNEAEIYEVIAQMVHGLGHDRSREVLDVCAATGLAGHHATANMAVRSMTLVDIDPAPLAIAAVRYEDRWPQFECVREDAVMLSGQRRYDLIIANSGYHHIEDERKTAFLQRLRIHLNSDGRILVGDHFLPPHGADDEEVRHALRAFYLPLLAELERRGTSAEAVAVVAKSFELALRRQVEFKVSWDRFDADARRAGLVIEEVIDIWNPGVARCGTKVVRLRSE